MHVCWAKTRAEAYTYKIKKIAASEGPGSKKCLCPLLHGVAHTMSRVHTPA